MTVSHPDAPANDVRKAELLSTTVEHIDITSFDARPIVDAMGKMSFTSRDLARATSIYNQMLADKDCSIFLVIAGSTSAGGCMDLYAELLRSNMIDRSEERRVGKECVSTCRSRWSPYPYKKKKKKYKNDNKSK